MIGRVKINDPMYAYNLSFSESLFEYLKKQKTIDKISVGPM